MRLSLRSTVVFRYFIEFAMDITDEESALSENVKRIIWSHLRAKSCWNQGTRDNERVEREIVLSVSILNGFYCTRNTQVRAHNYIECECVPVFQVKHLDSSHDFHSVNIHCGQSSVSHFWIVTGVGNLASSHRLLSTLCVMLLSFTMQWAALICRRRER